MGMAASQARFLGLTARKTNVEYEGQQVNQQRTALANQSAGLFNQMLSLKVPVPPNATDFYSMRYTFSNGASDCEILSYAAGQNGLYDLTIRESRMLPKSYKELTPYQVRIEYMQEDDGKGGKINVPYAVIGGDKFRITQVTDDDLQKDFNLLSNQFYQYTRNGVKENIAKEDWEKYNPTPEKPYTGQITQYFWKDTKQSQDVKYQGVGLIKDDKGKFTKIAMPDGSTYDLNITQVQDDIGYEKAMSDYNYQKMLYERTIADINTQTEIIQQQDRTLELRLRQLDTEQEALQQEMDAVKKVIDKNVEGTFKTFA